MHHETFLGAAAALATLPTVEATPSTDHEAAATQMCHICGGEKPAGMVERTTVDTIAPLEADICHACQHVQNHDNGDGQCMQCSDAVSSGFHIEVKFPLGTAELPGRLAGQLCGDCAGRVAADLNCNGIDADDTAREQLAAIIDEETERMADLEGVQ
jgi:formate dehydrogenase maturation protein FdhE